MRYWFVCFLLLSSVPALQAQQAPEPVLKLAQQLAQAEALPAPPLKEARRTLAQARQRFRQGLPAPATLFLTARVLDETANRVPRLVQVQQWQPGRIRGVLVAAAPAATTDLTVEFDEEVVLDWLILHPDGTEEGNYLGKYLDLEERLGALSGPR